MLFYTKQARLGKGAGLAPFKLNKGISKADFLEAFGIVEGKKAEGFDARSPQAQALKGVAGLYGKLVTNEIVRSDTDLSLEVKQDVAAGKNKAMASKGEKFSENRKNVFVETGLDSKSTPDFSEFNINYTKTLNSLLEGTGVDRINMKTEEGRERFLKFAIDSGLTKVLPPMFWRKLAFSTENAFTKAQLREFKEQGVEIKTIVSKDNALGDLREYTGNLPFKNVIEANKWIAKARKENGSNIFAKDSDFPAMKNMLTYEGVYSEKLRLDKALNDPEFVKRQDNSINELGKLFKMFQDNVMRNEDGTMNFEGVAFVGALLSSSSSGQGHFLRSSAPFRFYQEGYMKTGSSGNTLEHTLPATIVGKYLFMQALEGSVGENFKNIKNNYFQGPLSVTNDKKLKGKKLNGEKFDYVEQTPEGWKITDNIWARYFNINVGLNGGGINPSDLILAKGKSVYDVHNITSTGVKVDAKMKVSRSKGNKLDSDLVPKAIAYDKPVTTQTLINALIKTDKSLNNARKLDQPVKKIRVFDFDDTLARTKSNVLYTMPNFEGGFSEGSTKLKAIFMVGGPGAGKTNVGKGLQLGRRGYKVVNQDIALEAMKAESGLPAKESDYTADQRSTRSKLGAAARKAAVAKFDKYAANGDGMVIDGTGASYNATNKKIKALQEKGYEVHMVVANTPLETALERNRARTERSLPDFVVQKTYDQVQESLAKYKEDFGGRLYEINTEAIQYGKPLPGDFLEVVYEGINANKVGKIDAATFAKEAGNMEAQGAEWNFSEFSKVMEGSKGPLLDVAKIIADKRGTKDVFVLTARPADAAGPIKEFLASMGLNIPLANITGLGDGTPQAKAGWVMGKAAEGYNDFYFADDHTGNVKAVKDVLSQIDVKSKVQLAKASKGETFNTIVNDMIEDSSGIETYKKILCS